MHPAPHRPASTPPAPTPSASMRAITLHAFGPPENLRYEEVPAPSPGPGEVRIAVAGAGVHLVDTALRAGEANGPFPLPDLPTVPGREVAGAVDAVGDGVDPAWLGERVAAHLGTAPGGYAESAVVGVDRLHRLPADLPEDQALALVGTGRTALGVLRFTAWGPQDTVVILAAAGGIGSLLVQYARSRGATVIGAAGGAAKVAAVTELGADLAVDYTRPDWSHAVRRRFGARPATCVLDGVGGERASEAIELLAPGGTRLSYGWASAMHGTGSTTPAAPTSEERLAELGVTSQTVLGPALWEKIGGPQNIRVLEDESFDLAARGVWTPLTHRFPLARAAEAHQALEGRATTGKVVLVP